MTTQKGPEFFGERYRKLGGEATPVRIFPCIRVNTLKISENVLLQRLESIGMKLEKVPFLKNGYNVIKSRVSPGATAEHLLGYYYVQEAAAQLPVQVLDPKPGELVLDACAAPGGKTTQIAAYMQNTGTIIAYEVKEHRLKALEVNLERMATKNVIVESGDVLQAKGMKFDKILLDAPCSGNYAGDKFWFAKRDYEGVLASQKLQRELIARCLGMLKPGGTLVYSTCSLEPEENEIQIDWMKTHFPVQILPTGITTGEAGLMTIFGKKLHPDVKNTRRMWPAKTKTEGFFVAKVRI